MSRPGDEPTYHFDRPPRPSGSERRGPGRLRRGWGVLAGGAVLGIVLAAGAAVVLLGEARPPTDAGSARILVPIRALNGTDRFALMLLLRAPGTTSVEYQVSAECDDVAPEVVLMLSGDARLSELAVRGVSPATVSTASAGQPWFATPRQVQLVTLPLPPDRCRLGARPSSPGQDGTVAVVQGRVARRFENSASSEHALRLPQVGDEPHGTPSLPTVDARWAAAANVAVSASAGSLGTAERVDTAQPALSASGELSWSGSGFVVPSATWTDASAERRTQFLLVVIGIVIGVCAALLAAIALECLRSA